MGCGSGLASRRALIQPAADRVPASPKLNPLHIRGLAVEFPGGWIGVGVADITDTFSLNNPDHSGERDAGCRQSCNQGVSTKARRKIPRTPLTSRSRDTPSEPVTTLRPPRFGMSSPLQLHVFDVYASFTITCLPHSASLCSRNALKRWWLRVSRWRTVWRRMLRPARPDYALHPEVRQQDDVVVAHQPVGGLVVQFVDQVPDPICRHCTSMDNFIK